MNIDGLVSGLLESNIFWRLIRKRRKLNKELRARLDALRYVAASVQPFPEQDLYGHIQCFISNVRYFKDMYYDVSEFEALIKEQYGGIK